MREDPARELKGRIAAARSLFVLTGAGMSAESGISTFRDAMTGLWSRFDPAQLASEEGFRADPARVWDWYAERRAGVRAAQPNAGHLALGALGRPPRCAHCRNRLRPAVVWFGEMLPADALVAAERAARSCDVALIVGTSGAVWPAAGLAASAREGGALVAIVNPNDSEIDDAAQTVLRCTAAQALPTLLAL
jgi:NAD-dependent deacetylase